MKFEDLQNIATKLIHIPDGNLIKYYQIIPHLYKNFAWIPKKYQCYAGRAFVYVDSSGNLYPCSPLIDQSMGSLLEESIESIVSKPENKDRIIWCRRFRCGGCTMTCYMEKNIVLSKLHNPISIWKRIK